nr:unnamed protein product [Callosobruchus chinensis]
MAEASLCGVTREVKMERRCPQSGVLSPRLWNLVVDSRLVALNDLGMYAQGYADDTVILIRGKRMGTCIEIMQRAISIVERWCVTEGLSVNPSKMIMVPFTKQRNAKITRVPILFGNQIEVAREVKCLGIKLDDKLTWNSHIESITSRSQITLITMKRAIGCTWGLTPSMVNWLYTRVIRSMTVYSAIVWWPKVLQITASKALSKVQRAACLSITGAMKGTPTAALDVLLNIPPLDIYIEGEAKMSAYKMQCNGNWSYHPAMKHATILDKMRCDILEMPPDRMSGVVDTEIPYFVHLSDRYDWALGEPQQMSNGITWYTDRSKTSSGTGAGIHGGRPRQDRSICLGKLSNVFQAEIAAIMECGRICIDKGYNKKTIYVNTDSRVALMALASNHYTSNLVWDCHNTLKTLAKTNRVTLSRVPSHSGIIGNERADRCAKEGAGLSLTGPEPACGITYGMARTAVSR